MPKNAQTSSIQQPASSVVSLIFWILPIVPPIPLVTTYIGARHSALFSRRQTQVLRGETMKRTLVVLALALVSSAGCRAIRPMDNHGCGDACPDACASACDMPCHVATSQMAPRPDECCGECGGGCGGGCMCSNCCLFRRNCGQDCGPGYGPGPYDCSPCDAKGAWGCSGHRHPNGYVTGNDCGHCSNGRTQPMHAAVCGNGYCCAICGQPGPSCCCNSGDHNYNFAPGPPVAQTAYPYYTVRGPRDYLLDNPPPLGPY
jgi:hypothetical protein